MTPRIHEIFARLLVGPVVHATEHVDVDAEMKEHRGAAGVHVAEQPAVFGRRGTLRFDRL